MSEYDAFGRTKDESGHNDLGWGSADSDATPAPEADFTPVSTPTSPGPGRSRPSLGCAPAALIVPLVLFALVGGGIYLAVDAGRDAVNSARDTIESFSPPGNGNGGGGGRDDTVPEQIKPRDLFGSAGDLREALRIMEREVPGRITNFSIHDGNGINAQVVKGSERAVVLFAPDAEAPEVITRSEGSASSSSFSYEEIDPTAASRLMKAANSRLGQSPADVDYFVVSKSTGGMQWGIYYKGGKPIALGDSHGRYTRRIS